LTISDGKTLSVSNSLTLSGIDSSSVNFGSGGTVVYAANNLSAFASTTSSQLAGVITDETGTGSLVFADTPTLITPNLGVATGTSLNTTGNITVGGILKIEQANETFNTLSSSSGVVIHDCSTGQRFFHINISGNFTVNLINLNLDSGRVSSVILILSQGATAHTLSALQIDNIAQTVYWQFGSAPSGTVNKFDFITLTIFNSSGTYTVLGQLTTFG
jgi:hypothetical protein